MLDVDQAGELKAAFRRGNWTNAEIKTLSKGGLLRKVRMVILGLAEITPIEYCIDFDSALVIPAGLSVALDSSQVSSRVRGKRNVSYANVRLYQDAGQERNAGIVGSDLKLELNSQEVYGAQLLDFYLEHTDMIPEEWKTVGWIHFWGTIYCDSDRILCVRYLRWNGTRWISSYSRLDSVWYDCYPAAVSASPQV